MLTPEEEWGGEAGISVRGRLKKQTVVQSGERKISKQWRVETGER